MAPPDPQLVVTPLSVHENVGTHIPDDVGVSVMSTGVVGAPGSTVVAPSAPVSSLIMRAWITSAPPVQCNRHVYDVPATNGRVGPVSSVSEQPSSDVPDPP